MLGKIALEAIEKEREALTKISLDMWAQPEGPYREFKACDWIADYLT